MILIAALLLAQPAPAASGPELCGDLDSLAVEANAGKGCADIEAIEGCLERLTASPDEPDTEWLLADGSVVTRAEGEPDGDGGTSGQPLDGGPAQFLPIDAQSCLTYGAQSAVGGIWRDKLLAECLHVIGDASGRAGDQRAIEAQLVRAERLDRTCTAAAARTADRTTKAQQAATDAAQAQVDSAHPEVAVQAISAVICRTDAYDKWVRGQLKVANKIGGAENQVAAHQLRQLQHFLDTKLSDATRTLSERFRARPVACSKAPVRTLWHCVIPPTLIDTDGSEFVRDPEEPCEASEHFDWYQPNVGWHLGTSWFQPSTP